MSSFDPSSVRAAVARFTPGRPPRFQELSAARDVIVELREKRASYRAIAELLTQHCFPTSKTAIAGHQCDSAPQGNLLGSGSGGEPLFEALNLRWLKGQRRRGVRHAVKFASRQRWIAICRTLH